MDDDFHPNAQEVVKAYDVNLATPKSLNSPAPREPVVLELG